MLGLLVILVLVVIATGVVWAGSVALEWSADRLSRSYGLPSIVQGSIVVAIGSSFPELMSVVIATVRYGEFELGVSAIVGSAIFNILVIPALAALAHRETLESSRALVYREAQFYIIAIAMLLVTFSFAVIYFPVESDGLLGEIPRELAFVPIGLYVLYLFIQYLETGESLEHRSRPSASMLRQWGGLLVGLVLIFLGVEVLVYAAVEFGALFDTPAFLWGLTVVAIGTSLPDLIISVRAARGDRPTISLANVFGSNIFDLLIAIPIGVVIAGSTVVDYGVAAPLMAALIAATIVVFAVARTDFELTDREAFLLLGLYAIFIGWIVLESVGATAIMA